jgi:hypothetical protein
LYLALAIVSETCGAISIKLSGGLSKLAPSVLIFVFFGLAAAAFILALKVKDGESEPWEAEKAKEVRESQVKAGLEADLATKERAKQEAAEARERKRQQAEEARKFREGQAKARLEAKLAAKEKAEQEAAEARERKRREAEEAKRAKDAKAKARLEAELVAGEEAKQEVAGVEERKRRDAEEVGIKAGLAADTDLYEGNVTLTIMSPLDLGQMRKLEECLRQAENLQPVLVGGSEDETGIVIVSVQKPTPLISVLKAMPPVERVVKENVKILIVLKSSAAG